MKRARMEMRELTSRRVRSRIRCGDSGQAMAEFAIGVTVLLVILVGLFDVGRAVFVYNTLSEAAREGARAAVSMQGQELSAADIQALVVQRAAGMPVTVTVQPTDPMQRRYGQPVTVTVTSQFNSITPLVPAQLTLESKAVMYAE